MSNGIAYADQRTHQSMLRAQRVFKLRIEDGLSFRDIGIRLGISHTAARKLFRKWMEGLADETRDMAHVAREVELRRLDTLWQLNHKRATDPDIPAEDQARATDRCIKISESKRRLLGLDAPVKAELSGPEGGPINLVYGQVADMDDAALDQELAGFFNPGYMQGAADGFEAGLKAMELEQAVKQAEAPSPAKERPRKRAQRKPRVAAQQDQQDDSTAPAGQARTGQSPTPTHTPSAGQARV